MSYFKNYLGEVILAMTSVDQREWDKAYALMKSAKRIYVGGNGGSAAIANHLVCDWMKGTDEGTSDPLKVYSLNACIPLITAISNDIGYAHSLSMQLDWMLEEGDLVVLISSSGMSENIVNALHLAKSMEVPVIGMTGFDGGNLKAYADVRLHVSSKNYGVIEDVHSSIMHSLSQALKLERSE